MSLQVLLLLLQQSHIPTFDHNMNVRSTHTTSSSSLINTPPSQQAAKDLVAAFEQCHAKLLQQSQAQQQLHNTQQQSQQHQHHQLNASSSGASCLLVCLDQDNKQLLAASAGLCQAVLARAAPDGALTVLELLPRLALGFNVAETSRLDALGSRICYSFSGTQQQQQQQKLLQQQQQQELEAPAAEETPQQQQQQLSSSSSSTNEPVLIGPDGQALPSVRSSRLLGFSTATSAGVVPTPVVTSWRLSGEEAFVVLGSPGLWAAMNPAEVVDYVAAALGSGVCSLQPAAAPATDGTSTAAALAGDNDADAGGDALPDTQQDAAAATGFALKPDAAVLLSDLLTLEAQERLKLRLVDNFLGLGSVVAANNQQVVPDVTATVLLLSGPLPAQKAAVDGQLINEQLTSVTRCVLSHTRYSAFGVDHGRWYMDLCGLGF